jgi:hypothetical protein
MKRAAAILILGAGFVFGHEGHEGKPVTLNGTVVDTGCYMTHDSKGPEHAACAMACAKNGVPLAIVDASGKLYISVASDHQNPNAKLMNFIEKKVKVTGTLLQKGGVNGIAIKTVEAVK